MKFNPMKFCLKPAYDDSDTGYNRIGQHTALTPVCQ